ncbi:MAG: energy transducer TonB [Acidobacteriaceae bacterium]
MKILRGILCCLLLCSPLVYAAQPAPSLKQAEKELKGKTVFLRGMEAGDKLVFDAQGAEVGSYQTGSFAYSAIQIQKIHLTDAQLEMRGKRVALVLHAKSNTLLLSDAQFVPLHENVDVVIGVDAAHPEAIDAAIGKVFAFSAAEVVGGLPPVAEKIALYSLGSDAPPVGKTETPYKPGTPGLSPPRLLHSVAPAFTDEARQNKASGLCVLSMIVDTTGRPEHIRIVQSLAAGGLKTNRPLDGGLQFNAVKAASQYRFDPARLRGTPVPVAINVVVNFRIY